jgi:catechol 2,3-dioxygenase-like lactoylglutathione lyase family enzyme
MKMVRPGTMAAVPVLCAAATLALTSCAGPAPERDPRPAAEAVASAPACAAPASARVRLDHVPIAVRELEAATAHYRDRLGFAIKPGRPHPNSILNSHQKFRDGTQLELITATEPRDGLAREYIAFLEGGDGGAYLAFDAGRADSLTAFLRALEPEVEGASGEYGWVGFPDGHPLDYVFFSHGTPSPTDLPEHFAHPNIAAGLYAVWLVPADPSAEVRLLEHLGAVTCPSSLRLPIGNVQRELRLQRGSVYLVPTPGTPRRRAIAGVTVRVTSIDSARAALHLPPGAAREGSDARGAWLRVPPEHANGIWMELLEPPTGA